MKVRDYLNSDDANNIDREDEIGRGGGINRGVKNCAGKGRGKTLGACHGGGDHATERSGSCTKEASDDLSGQRLHQLQEGDSIHFVFGLVLLYLIVGLGLLFLTVAIAASNSEDNKMSQLRQEMELNVQSANEKDEKEPHHHGKGLTSISLHVHLSESAEAIKHDHHTNYKCNGQDDDAYDASSPSLQNHGSSLPTHDAASDITSLNEKIEQKVEEMRHLEEELEAELCRLQEIGHLDVQQDPAGDQDRVLDDDGGVIEEDLHAAANLHRAVSPQELKIRLHVMLEARQEQRITDLEYQVQSLKQELTEKAIELARWRELVSKHVSSCKPAPPSYPELICREN